MNDVMLAIESGKPVPCEKPMGMNAAECREMVEAARRSNLPLGVAQVFRFERSTETLRERVAARLIGKPVFARSEFSFLVRTQVPHAPTQGEAKSAPPAQNLPSCASTSSNSSAGHASSQANPERVTVMRSWKASVPRSSTQQDAIQGYYVYRGGTSNSYNDANQLNSDPLPGTQCIDTAVAPGGSIFTSSGQSLQMGKRVTFKRGAGGDSVSYLKCKTATSEMHISSYSFAQY